MHQAQTHTFRQNIHLYFKKEKRAGCGVHTSLIPARQMGLSSRPAWATYQISGQASQVHIVRETLSEKNEQNTKTSRKMEEGEGRRRERGGKGERKREGRGIEREGEGERDSFSVAGSASSCPVTHCMVDTQDTS